MLTRDDSKLTVDNIPYTPGGARVDLVEVRDFVSSYQDVTPLTTGELWALPIMLRLSILNTLAHALSKITRLEPPAFATAPSSGPRHFALHPNGRFAYVINELNSTVSARAFPSSIS